LHCCNNIPETSGSKEARFIVVYGFRGTIPCSLSPTVLALERQKTIMERCGRAKLLTSGGRERRDRERDRDRQRHRERDRENEARDKCNFQRHTASELLPPTGSYLLIFIQL
jgi:hypothetical protein